MYSCNTSIYHITTRFPTFPTHNRPCGFFRFIFISAKISISPQRTVFFQISALNSLLQISRTIFLNGLSSIWSFASTMSRSFSLFRTI